MDGGEKMDEVENAEDCGCYGWKIVSAVEEQYG